MTIQDFVDRYLQPCTVKGSEIVPRLCPYCKGGRGGKDKETFAMNADTGTFNCKRGSCGRQGSFWTLCQDFGERADIPRTHEWKQKAKTYVKPQTAVKPGVSQYLTGRGINAATQEAYHIGTDGNGNIVFPLIDESGEMVGVKFRPAHDVEHGERKAWREKDTKPVLFGMHLCDPGKPLCIFEGEIDAMSGHVAGLPNCVSVPSGAEDFTWLDTCWDFLHTFKEVRLFGDSDGPGLEMQRQIGVRLSDIIISRVDHEHKDANEMLTKDGAEIIRKAYGAAKEVPPVGLIRLADVTPFDPSNAPKHSSGINKLDNDIGGFLMGDMTIWTGRRGEGKSTILGQVLLEAVDGGRKVCAYSGELPAPRFQQWIDLQAAGEPCISERTAKDNPERKVFFLNDYTRNRIHAWYSDLFFLHDNTIADGNESDSILRVFDIAARRYGCSVFMVDNLMTAQYNRISEKDFLRRQSAFAGQLVEFARRHNVHVHLVAHPRKSNSDLENDDVAGLSDLTNRAANVLAVQRISDEKKKLEGYDTLLRLMKNRWEGKHAEYGLNYCAKDRRLYLPSAGNARCYGWMNTGEQIEIDDGGLPF